MEPRRQAVRSAEWIGGKTVGWANGVGEGMEERIRELLVAYADYAPQSLIVEVSPKPHPMNGVFSIHSMEGCTEALLLFVYDAWWHRSPENVEYDMVMCLAIAHLIGLGKLRVGPAGMELDEAAKLGLEPTEYLNGLAEIIICKRHRPAA